MGKAGKALREVLETYRINQNRLATTMGIDRSRVNRWVHEERDPSGETIVEIKEALRNLEPAAAKEFVRLYLGDSEE
jgi:plasmid maintenance system antidote protein VapI